MAPPGAWGQHGAEEAGTTLPWERYDKRGDTGVRRAWGGLLGWVRRITPRKVAVRTAKGGEFPAGRAGQRGVMESGTLPKGGAWPDKAGEWRDKRDDTGFRSEGPALPSGCGGLQSGRWGLDRRRGRGTRRTPRRKRGAAPKS